VKSLHLLHEFSLTSSFSVIYGVVVSNPFYLFVLLSFLHRLSRDWVYVFLTDPTEQVSPISRVRMETKPVFETLCPFQLRTGRPRGQSSSPGRVKNFISSRPALEPRQSPIHWVTWAVSRGVKRQRREADHLELVPRSRKRGSIHPLSHTPSCHSAYLVKHKDKFTFTFYVLSNNRTTNKAQIAINYECYTIVRPLLFLSRSSSVVLTRLSGPRSRPTTSQKIW
jgi:hypothetical protein